MPKMKVIVTKYGFTTINADTENKAIKATHDMQESEFDWSDFNDAQVVKTNINE